MSLGHHVCLRCRVLCDGRCDFNHRHACADLSTETGCAKLAKDVWTSPAMVGFTSPEARVASVGASALGVGIGLLAAGPIALAAIPVLAGLGLGLRRRSRRELKHPRGIGAYLRQSSSRRLRRRGRLEGDNTLTAPFSGRKCLAYSFFFRADESFGGNIMLAGGHHGGFRLRDADESWEVVAEPGALRLATESATVSIGGVAQPATLGIKPAAVEPFLAKFDKSLRASERPGLVYESVEEVAVRSGAEVETYGRIVAAAFSYRSSGAQFRFAALPQVLVLEDK